LFDGLSGFRNKEIASFETKKRDCRVVLPKLILGDCELCFRQIFVWTFSGDRPQNLPQATAIRTAESPGQFICLSVGQFLRDTIHAALPIQGSPQIDGIDSAVFPGEPASERSWIKVVDSEF
jgi:hypothetical protein